MTGTKSGLSILHLPLSNLENAQYFCPLNPYKNERNMPIIKTPLILEGGFNDGNHGKNRCPISGNSDYWF